MGIFGRSPEGTAIHNQNVENGGPLDLGELPTEKPKTVDVAPGVKKRVNGKMVETGYGKVLREQQEAVAKQKPISDLERERDEFLARKREAEQKGISGVEEKWKERTTDKSGKA